jgi:hypothetical protein
MMAGDFEKAWQTGDAIESLRPTRLWNGQPFGGKRVMVRCLHGLGDTIQFIRYAAELKRAGAVSVTAQMHPELVELVSTAPGLDAAIPWGPQPEYDLEIEVMELPWAFRTRADTIPANFPYLSPATERGSRLRAGHPRIGLIWASSAWDTTRSIPLARIAPVLPFKPYSLQHGPEHAQAIGRCDIFYAGEQSSDIMQTATDLMNLDLLITVDTMAAHLAGALARPVWVLLRHDADWRWMRDRGDTPWYPTMRLFRQPEPGDWDTPIREIREELANYSFPRVNRRA